MVPFRPLSKAGPETKSTLARDWPQGRYTVGWAHLSLLTKLYKVKIPVAQASVVRSRPLLRVSRLMWRRLGLPALEINCSQPTQCGYKAPL